MDIRSSEKLSPTVCVGLGRSIRGRRIFRNFFGQRDLPDGRADIEIAVKIIGRYPLPRRFIIKKVICFHDASSRIIAPSPDHTSIVDAGSQRYDFVVRLRVFADDGG